MRFLQAEFNKRLAETVSGASEYHLLTDGANLYLETSARQIVNVLKNSKQPMLAICLSDTVRRMHDLIKHGKKDLGCAPAGKRTTGSQKLAS
ncbi:MAG TPA: hypothetical protein VFA74_14690 [Terriglobales bacterium]|nr:hypothetical protein [Terriglobales bacterium]